MNRCAQSSNLCRFLHNRYSTVVVAHLLGQPIQLGSPKTASGRCSLFGKLATSPVSQLKSRLSKVDLGVVKECCGLYLSPESPPGEYTVWLPNVSGP